MLTDNKNLNSSRIFKMIHANQLQELAKLLLDSVNATTTNVRAISIGLSLAILNLNIDELVKCLEVIKLVDAISKNDSAMLTRMKVISSNKDLILSQMCQLICRSKTTEEFAKYFKLVIELFDLKSMCKKFASLNVAAVEQPEYLNLLRMIKAGALPQKYDIVPELIYRAIQVRSLKQLRAIYAIFPTEFAAASLSLTAAEPTNESINLFFAVMKDINSFPDDVYKLFFIQNMEKLLLGLGYLSYETGLLALAAKYVNKQLDDEPPIIVPEKQLDKLFELLLVNKPQRLRFIICGTHWAACDVSIDDMGNATVLLVDSLGSAKSLPSFIIDIISSIRKHINNYEVFVTEEVRQGAQAGCSVFALDDLIHLLSLEKYLDSTVYPNALFDFLKKNVTRIESPITKGYELENVNIVRTPLHLLRTMQSTVLLEIMQSKRDGEAVLNKRKVTPAQYAVTKPHFFERKVESENVDKLCNLRLDYKLKKMLDRCYAYMLKNDLATIQSAMQQYTLEGFEKRMQAKRAKLKL